MFLRSQQEQKLLKKGSKAVNGKIKQLEAEYENDDEVAESLEVEVKELEAGADDDEVLEKEISTMQEHSQQQQKFEKGSKALDGKVKELEAEYENDDEAIVTLDTEVKELEAGSDDDEVLEKEISMMQEHSQQQHKSEKGSKALDGTMKELEAEYENDDEAIEAIEAEVEELEAGADDDEVIEKEISMMQEQSQQKQKLAKKGSNTLDGKKKEADEDYEIDDESVDAIDAEEKELGAGMDDDEVLEKGFSTMQEQSMQKQKFEAKGSKALDGEKKEAEAEYENIDESVEALDYEEKELEAGADDDEVSEIETAEVKEDLEEQGNIEGDEFEDEESEAKDAEPVLNTPPADDPFERSSQGQLASSESEVEGMGMGRHFVWITVVMILYFIIWKVMLRYRQKKELKEQRGYRSIKADRELGYRHKLEYVDSDDSDDESDHVNAVKKG